MNTITVERHSVEGATRSQVSGLGLSLYGIERPWAGNRPFESCIPHGIYVALPHTSERHGECLALVGGTVSLQQSPDARRFACLFHVANWADQVQGCIGVGLREAESPRGPMVQSSREAMRQLLDAVSGPVQVVIRWQ